MRARSVQSSSLLAALIACGLAFAVYSAFPASVATTTRPETDCYTTAKRLPKITIWAWDYPQDLSFIKPQTAQVAYYAGTVYLQGEHVFFRPRTKELKIAQGVIAYPVLRIESGGLAATKLKPEIYSQIVSVASELQSRHQARTIQIDFDATESEHRFYSELLKSLRAALPAGTHIQITALASWCTSEAWLKSGLCDEQVVMCFSMGHAGAAILPAIDRRKYTSIGLSVSEPQTNKKLKKLGFLDSARHLFVFNSRPWTNYCWLKIKEEVTVR